MLTEEQASAIKKQIIEHIEKNFPNEKKEFAKHQVHNMDAEALEKFLANNNLIAGQNNQCVFCSIIFGDIPSYKIDENQEAIAVLEINPASRGHCLIIPRKHLKDETEMPEEAKNLAEKVSKRIKASLKPKKVETISSNIFGHNVINLLPVYANESLSSKRHPAKKEELEEIEKLLNEKQKTSDSKKPLSKKTKIEKIVEKFEKKLWLPQRIP